MRYAKHSNRLGFPELQRFSEAGTSCLKQGVKMSDASKKKIERRLKQALRYSVPVFIRTHAELKEIAALEPFDRPAILRVDVNIILLAHNLDEKSKAKLMALTTDTDGFCVHGREIYWWRRKKPGTSLFSTMPLTRVLREPFTIRSSNTIRKLVAKWP